jgi:glycosyltransferase involved in cell wall biosynthesis
MKILMMTNTYLPMVGGVARSVKLFADAYRELGHDVLVVAPQFSEEAPNDPDVVRVPAIVNFNGSDFSVRLPIPGLLRQAVEDFQPQIVHAHHPFLLGDTALRIAGARNLPLVFTHHTMYERYTHYVPGDSTPMRDFAVELATRFANLCDQVVAPSASIARILRDRGVKTSIEPIPTGIEYDQFRHGDGQKIRRRFHIPADAVVVGHVGRLAPEKNLAFLARTVANALSATEHTHCLIVGDGPSADEIQEIFKQRGLSDRLVLSGSLSGQDLVDAYHAMDVFAFASLTETQGMVLAEAMAAGRPVVALDAPGARETVRDPSTGRLVKEEDESAFTGALLEVLQSDADARRAMGERGQEAAADFDTEKTAEETLSLYERVIAHYSGRTDEPNTFWDELLRRAETEWNLWSSRAEAASKVITQAIPSTEKPTGRKSTKQQ